MPYQTLYRKWRPLTFDDVRGQQAIVRALKNQIKTDRIAHAYLFCGTRGTGKTSVAKIMARAVNCPHAAEHDGSPCNTCSVCKSILNDASVNVTEMDAASHNGVDDVRALVEEVKYPPTQGRYRVYIIDEVHMMSPSAFNAFLKTLEEPPSYVIFILATTDPQKIPQTILSRVQRYDFRRIAAATIADRIHELLRAEDIPAEDRAVRYLARMADGSMRDALSLLDQCLSFSIGKQLSYETVLDVLGAVDTSVFSRLYRALCAREPEQALLLVQEAIEAGRDVPQFLNDLILYLRNVLLAAYGGLNALDVGTENEAALLEDAALSDRDTLLRFLFGLSELSNRMRFAAQKRILLETELIRLCLWEPTETTLQKRAVTAPGSAVTAQAQAASDPRRAEKVSPEAPAPAKATSPSPAPAKATPLPAAPAKPAPESPAPVKADIGERTTSSSALSMVRENWTRLLDALSPDNRAVFTGTELLEEQPGKITVVFRNSLHYKLAAMNRKENGLLRLSALVREQTGQELTFLARVAKPGEFQEKRDIITDEDLLKIHFPVETE